MILKQDKSFWRLPSMNGNTAFYNSYIGKIIIFMHIASFEAAFFIYNVRVRVLVGPVTGNER